MPRSPKLTLTIALYVTLLCGIFLPTALFAEEGFGHQIEANATAKERSDQPRFWIMEVEFKPMRLIWVSMKDKASGTIKKQPVWYLCYRAIRRPVTRIGVSGLIPKNPPNPEPGQPFFIPEFTLITNDGKAPGIFSDVLIPVAQKEIQKIEERNFKNTVQIVAKLPEASDKPFAEAKNVFHGVAMFRGMDPRTDRFTVIMSGFSNGYEQTKGPDGNPIVLRKTIRQEFWRPGDKFDQESKEFRFTGDPKWFYRPDTPATKLKTE